jgi:S-DNA-T family DNA segregation ATPase FtsK/SpoIIIE
MASSKNNKKEPNQTKRNKRDYEASELPLLNRLHPETKKTILAIAAIGIALVLCLAYFEQAGPVGHYLRLGGIALLGIGYIVLPISLLIVAGVFLLTDKHHFLLVAFSGAGGFLLSVLGLIHIAQTGQGGYLGRILGSLELAFGAPAAIILNLAIGTIAIVTTLNIPIKIRLPQFNRKTVITPDEIHQEDELVRIAEETDIEEIPEETGVNQQEEKAAEEEQLVEQKTDTHQEIEKNDGDKKINPIPPLRFANYVLPPLDLLKSSVEKPTTGDLRANANIIKRTLESFGIAVEMGEVNIGPKVTRYTLKPAEGVKLTRILALHQDLALALAAHPIRIEAPIPGKSLVGIEVPNKTAAIVRLGNLFTYPDFQATGPLGFVLGRDVSGDPLFARVDKMPHLLVAGATGSGKSILVHSLIISLLYKNSPDTLRFAFIDPKRVELTMYDGLPHLIHPVITDNKKAIAVFRWAIKEMERRYELLAASGRRDIASFNGKNPDEALPYIVIVVDELADLMATYGREVEGSIIRLAQMARATGIHLILATQRPSVEVITGLIKANITNRIALQVASQIDSRTILDAAGAEKLLGGGDLLFLSPQLSQPKRIQGAFITEDEIGKVTNFIRENNKIEIPKTQESILDSTLPQQTNNIKGEVLDDFMEGSQNDDEMLEEAIQVVKEAKKASASLLQRRLKVGYARAARLLDLMEERGIVGPGDGAKPREVFIEE